MLDEARALELIYAAVDEINGQQPPEARLPKAPGTVLYGDDAVLDSLGFINLLVAIEERVGRSGGPAIRLLDEVGRTDAETPLRTLGTVAAFLAQARKACA